MHRTSSILSPKTALFLALVLAPMMGFAQDQCADLVTPATELPIVESAPRSSPTENDSTSLRTGLTPDQIRQKQTEVADEIKQLMDSSEFIAAMKSDFKIERDVRSWTEKLRGMNYRDVTAENMKLKMFLFELDTLIRLRKPTGALDKIRGFMSEFEEVSTRLVAMNRIIKNKELTEGPIQRPLGVRDHFKNAFMSSLPIGARVREIGAGLWTLGQKKIGAFVPEAPKRDSSFADIMKNYDDHLRYLGRNYFKYKGIRDLLDKYISTSQKLTGSKPEPVDLNSPVVDALTDTALAAASDPTNGVIVPADDQSLALSKSLAVIEGRVAQTVLDNSGILADRAKIVAQMMDGQSNQTWSERPQLADIRAVYESELLAQVSYLRLEFRSELYRLINIPQRLVNLIAKQITALELKTTSKLDPRRAVLAAMKVFLGKLSDMNLVLDNINDISTVIEQRAVVLESELVKPNATYDNAIKRANEAAMAQLISRNVQSGNRSSGQDELFYAFARIAETRVLWSELMDQANKGTDEGLKARMKAADDKANKENSISIIYNQTFVQLLSQFVVAGAGSALVYYAPAIKAIALSLHLPIP